MLKSHVLIARSVNKFSKPPKINAPTIARNGPTCRVSKCGRPLAVGGQGVTSGIRAEPRRVWSLVLVHTNMSNDLGEQRLR